MMFSSQEFYHGFQINHFDYKQLNNRYLLERPNKEIEKIIKPILGGNIEEFKRSVKVDIRLTFLLSIETLFELIFALLPDKKGIVHDADLIFQLAKKTFYYDELRKFNKGEPSKLDHLKTERSYQNGRSGTLLRHLFYFGLWKDEVEQQIQSSLATIDDALKILSGELSNREELNSYKHGFRGIPFVKSFMLADFKTHEKKLNFEIDDSVTIYSYNKETEAHEYLTKSFDPDRDMLLTHTTSNLIYNIIQPRKVLFKKDKQEDIPYLMFFDEELKKASKVNVNIQDLKITSTPEKK